MKKVWKIKRCFFYDEKFKTNCVIICCITVELITTEKCASK